MEPGETGLAAVYAQERPALLRFLRARCGDEGEAQDLLQDLWLKLDGLATGPIDNARAYLFRMANNLVFDRRRARLRAMQRDNAWLGQDHSPATGTDANLRPDPAPRADDVLAEREEAAVLHRAIAQLPPGARRALQLYRFEGHDQGQVAAIMGISRSGVEKHLAVAMKNLRQALSDCGILQVVASREQQAAGNPAACEDQGQ